MNDEFFATVKLITGEEILGLISVFDDGITIENSLLLEDMSIFEGIIDTGNVSLKLSKWLKSSTDDTLFINDNKIITISELKEPGLSFYKKAVVDISRADKRPPRVKKRERYNGNKSTVKEARIKFEKLFDDY